jgi:hypothetical protein
MRTSTMETTIDAREVRALRDVTPEVVAEEQTRSQTRVNGATVRSGVHAGFYSPNILGKLT